MNRRRGVRKLVPCSGRAVVILQQPTQPLAATNVGAPERAGPWSDQVVAEPLMVSLPVVVRGDSAGGNHYRRVVRLTDPLPEIWCPHICQRCVSPTGGLL